MSWEPYTNQVVVSREDTELYRFTIGQDQAVMGDVTVGLVAPSKAEEGVTLMALDDLCDLPSPKLVTSFLSLKIVEKEVAARSSGPPPLSVWWCHFRRMRSMAFPLASSSISLSR